MKYAATYRGGSGGTGSFSNTAASTAVAPTPDVGFTYDAARRIASRTEDGQATTDNLYQPWGAAWKETMNCLNPRATQSAR